MEESTTLVICNFEEYFVYTLSPFTPTSIALHMKDFELDIESYRKELFIEINQKIGEPKYPSAQQVNERWKGICQFAMPRTFRHIIRVKDFRITHSHGFDELGYKNGGPTTVMEFSNLHHENLRLITDYYTLAIYDACIKHPNLFKEKGLAFCTTKSVVDAMGEYWWIYQMTTPVQFDSNGYMASYMSQYVILGKYHGQALETDIYFDADSTEEAKKLKLLMSDVKDNILLGLRFTKVQKYILQYAAKGLAMNMIARELEITKGTLNNHRSNILRKARDIFPTNNFKYFKDVVQYLDKQQLI